MDLKDRLKMNSFNSLMFQIVRVFNRNSWYYVGVLLPNTQKIVAQTVVYDKITRAFRRKLHDEYSG